jgi:hypothetical protein
MNHLVLNDPADNMPSLILVLEPGNFHRMTRGDPVVKRLHDFFPDGLPKRLKLVLFYSETPIADAKKFAQMAKQTVDLHTPEQKTRPHCPECHSTIEQFGVFRNESPMAIVFCPECGCVYGMVPQEVMKLLPPVEKEKGE